MINQDDAHRKIFLDAVREVILHGMTAENPNKSVMNFRSVLKNSKAKIAATGLDKFTVDIDLKPDDKATLIQWSSKPGGLSECLNSPIAWYEQEPNKASVVVDVNIFLQYLIGNKSPDPSMKNLQNTIIDQILENMKMNDLVALVQRANLYQSDQDADMNALIAYAAGAEKLFPRKTLGSDRSLAGYMSDSGASSDDSTSVDGSASDEDVSKQQALLDEAVKAFAQLINKYTPLPEYTAQTSSTSFRLLGFGRSTSHGKIPTLKESVEYDDAREGFKQELAKLLLKDPDLILAALIEISAEKLTSHTLKAWIDTEAEADLEPLLAALEKMEEAADALIPKLPEIDKVFRQQLESQQQQRFTLRGNAVAATFTPPRGRAGAGARASVVQMISRRESDASAIRDNNERYINEITIALMRANRAAGSEELQSFQVKDILMRYFGNQLREDQKKAILNGLAVSKMPGPNASLRDSFNAIVEICSTVKPKPVADLKLDGLGVSGRRSNR